MNVENSRELLSEQFYFLCVDKICTSAHISQYTNTGQIKNIEGIQI